MPGSICLREEQAWSIDGTASQSPREETIKNRDKLHVVEHLRGTTCTSTNLRVGRDGNMRKFPPNLAHLTANHAQSSSGFRDGLRTDTPYG